MQILIFRGDIHVNGNGRDTYKFRAIHPYIFLILSDSITQRKYLARKKRRIGLWCSAVSKGWLHLNKSGVIKVYLSKTINYIKSRNYAMLVSCSKWFDHAARISCTQETENRFVVFQSQRVGCIWIRVGWLKYTYLKLSTISNHEIMRYFYRDLLRMRFFVN